MERQKNYVGIDVAKAGMDIAVRPTDERWSISNDDLPPVQQGSDNWYPA